MSSPIVKSVSSKDGTVIYADAIGNAANPAIVFIHGLCATADVFNGLFTEKRLIEQFYLVRYDDRGNGRSGKPMAEGSYDSLRRAEDFAAVLDAFALNKPFLAGWYVKCYLFLASPQLNPFPVWRSLGGTNAADIVRHHGPDYISGVIYLASLPCLGDVPGRVATPLILGLLPKFMSTDDATLALTSRIEMSYSLSARPNDVPFSIMASWIGGATLLSPAIIGHIFAREHDDAAALFAAGHAGKLPITLIHGTEDSQIFLEKVIPEYNNGGEWKEMSVKRIVGAGHMVFYDALDETVDGIIEFVHSTLAV